MAQTSAATLRVRLQGAGLVAVAATRLWGAEDRSEALTSARALRNWLDERSEGHVFVLLPQGAAETGAATGLDREIAHELAAHERSRQLRFGVLDQALIAIAPRLSVLCGTGSEARVDAYYAARDAAPALAGPLAGVSHLVTTSAADSWLGAVQESLRPLTGPLADLTERLRAFRFGPGMPRVLSPLFQGIAGRRVALEIEDPWCGVRPHARRRLAGFLAAAKAAGVDIARLSVVWNPDHGAPVSPEAQASAVLAELRSVGIVLTPEFSFRSGRDRHFHDRVVTARSLDEGPPVNLRWDVTAGIDNLMSPSKECSVFIEER